jgi:hypothetical protein
MLGRVLSVGVVVSAVLLAVVLRTTQPATVGPLGILAVFVLMYVLVLGVATFLLFGASKVIYRISSLVTVKKPIHSLSLVRTYYFASVLALAPVMLIGMQSVGEVGIYDVLLVVIFVVIACIYISKRTS